MMTRAVVGGLAAVLGAATILGRAPATPQTLPPTAERAYHAVATRFDETDALSIVSFMDQYWRVAGNPGFNASIDRIRDRLVSGGYRTDATPPAHVRVEEFANSSRGWDYRVGTGEFDGASEPPLLSRERERVSLAIK